MSGPVHQAEDNQESAGLIPLTCDEIATGPTGSPRPQPPRGGQAGITTLAWDDQGNQLSSIDPTGAQTLSTYDVAERLCTKVQVVRDGTATPTKYATTYGYDQFGDKTSRSGLLRNSLTAGYSRGCATRKTFLERPC